MIPQDIFDYKEYIVPVIGENSFFYYAEDGSKIPLQEFLIDKIIQTRNVRHPEDLPVDQMKKRGFYGLSLCRQKCFSRDEEFTKCYNSIIREYRESIHLDETIKDFLSTYQFHLIITTCCFDFIEKALPPYYSSKVYIAANGANNNEDINEQDFTIYHILGKYNNSSIWAWDEESLMYILHCHHNNDCASNGLRRYIFPDQNLSKQLKSLLVLYSNLPDWLFRFFLFPLAYKDKWSSGYYLNSQKDEDDSLKNFIERVICYDMANNEIESVLKEAVELKKIEERNKKNPVSQRIEHGMQYDIFISHATEDYELAIEIKSKLVRYNLDVWLDVNGGIPDGNYTQRMKDGIKNSAYYMPLITRSYLNKLTNGACEKQMTMDEILKNNGTMSYVQKEALAADLQWKELKRKYPSRTTYLLPVLFPEQGLSYDTINQCISFQQLPEDLFKDQSIFDDKSMFKDKDWSRYKTIEKD